MTDQSRTPRTDAFEDAHTQYDNEVFIGYQAEFCRALEIEAADLRERECHHGWRGTKPEDGERITTPCPACGCRSLFIGSGGHLVCGRVPSDSSDGCPSPSVEDTIKDLRERLAEAQSGAGAWMKFAVHQEHCQTCGEAVSDCEIGTTLKAAALKGADHE